jgi:hypothetical protein
VALAGGAALAAGGTAPIAASAPVTMPQVHPSATARRLPDFGNPGGRAAVPGAAAAVGTSRPDHVVGTRTPASCTSTAVVRAVASGGVITFDCGPSPVTITMTATAKVVNTSHRIVLDGGGTVTLSGAGKRQILYMNTCDKAQQWTTSDCYDQEWPELVVQNMTFEDGNSTVSQSRGTSFGGGGGAIFDLGGQLKVVNSRFIDNRCYDVGPDLGGAAVRALAQWRNKPVYITNDTFRGGRCSNGAALSSIGVSWVVLNSIMTNNDAIGYGANPASSGTPGGGSGGAIYCDGDTYSLEIEGTVIRDNHAREGGGAIFFVSDDNTGTLTIESSTLQDNPSAGFWTRPYPGIFFQSYGHSPKVVGSTIS